MGENWRRLAPKREWSDVSTRHTERARSGQESKRRELEESRGLS